MGDPTQPPQAPALELDGVVLVGVDGSERGEDAVALGSLLGRALSRPVVLVHVAGPTPLGQGAADFRRLARERGQAVLDEAGGDLPPATGRRLIEGVTAERGLHDLAEESRAGLIVLGSCGHGALGRVLLGSVAENLTTWSPCTVAVAPAGYRAAADKHALRRIGVGFDDMPESRAALDFAVGLAGAAGAALALWCVVAPTGAEGSHPERYGEFTRYMHAVARRELDDGLARVPAEIGATSKVMEGHPAEQIAEEAISDDVDLVVVGSRGHGPAASVFLGSTARKLMRAATCPVAVVPRPD